MEPINWGEIITQDMLMGIINSITGMIPLIIPVVITLIGIKIGIRFMRGQLKG